MALREVYLPVLARTFKLGMQFSPGHAFRATLPRWGDNACASMPAPPVSVDYSPLAAASLAQVDFNDRLGDCVIAKGAHLVGVHTGNSNGGNPWLPTQNQILADYGAIGGYNGTPQSDRGCNPQAALEYWKSYGFFRSGNPSPISLSGYGVVDGRNQYLIRQVIHQFETLDINFSMPDAYITQGQMGPNGNGFVWDIAGPANPYNGHSILGVGYNADGILIDTWGLRGLMTWRAVAQYLIPAMRAELYAVVTPALIKPDGTTPAGQDWPTVVSFANTLGANIPAPAPTPTPQPSGRVFSIYPDSHSVTIPTGAKVTHDPKLGGAVIVATAANEVRLTSSWAINRN